MTFFLCCGVNNSSGVDRCGPPNEENRCYPPNEVDRSSLQEKVDPVLLPSDSGCPFLESHPSFLVLADKSPNSIGRKWDQSREALSASLSF